MTAFLDLIPADGWWLLTRAETEDDTGRWRRDQLVAWGLVDDGPTVPTYVAGLTLDAGAEAVVVAAPGRYVHDREWLPCGCVYPDASHIDAAWCRYCGGTVAQ